MTQPRQKKKKNERKKEMKIDRRVQIISEQQENEME
jgi:hypothetical protein